MVKKKTRAKAKKTVKKVSAKKIAASKPLNKLHDSAIKVVARVVKAEEAVVERVKAVEEKVEVAKDKLVAVAKKANASPVAKRAHDAAKNAVKKASAVLTDVRIKARSASLAVKEAVAHAELHRKKEELKQKAIASFTDKWERAYDKTMASRAKKKKKRRTSVKKKAA